MTRSTRTTKRSGKSRIHKQRTEPALRELFPIREAADHLPRRGGRKLSQTTIYRWVNPGVQGVALRVVTVGAVMHTCERWLMEFAEEVDRRRRLAAKARSGVTRRSRRTQSGRDSGRSKRVSSSSRRPASRRCSDGK